MLEFAGQQFTVVAGDLPDLEFRGADAGIQIDPIRVQAFDGFSYSEEASFTMFTTTAPSRYRESEYRFDGSATLCIVDVRCLGFGW